MNFNLLIALFATCWISGKSFPAVTSKNKVYPLRMGFVFFFYGTQNKKSWSVKKICLGHIFSGCGATGCAARPIMVK